MLIKIWVASVSDGKGFRFYFIALLIDYHVFYDICSGVRMIRLFPTCNSEIVYVNLNIGLHKYILCL